ncbi:hypothetical protein FOZ63_019857 [Perkinsus olseni]|uniref:Uncharacterized protein n=1 Tax=Perkinsus olseni TaxID=32597 RepID=A0A7J6RH85_PEROL|nr:hypothetical protein FOZ63_019857 [Perkinsus olseni]
MGNPTDRMHVQDELLSTAERNGSKLWEGVQVCMTSASERQQAGWHDLDDNARPVITHYHSSFIRRLLVRSEHIIKPHPFRGATRFETVVRSSYHSVLLKPSSPPSSSSSFRYDRAPPRPPPILVVGGGHNSDCGELGSVTSQFVDKGRKRSLQGVTVAVAKLGLDAGGSVPTLLHPVAPAFTHQAPNH